MINIILQEDYIIEVKENDSFGKWTVLKEDIDRIGYKSKGKRYICKCECGTIKSVSKSSLISGKSKSCGCAYNPPKILDGQRFGKLTVVESIQNYNNTGKSAYRCICDCGNETIVKSTSIYKTKSCGCYKYDKALNLIGSKFGKLTIENIRFEIRKTIAECVCDCGNKTEVRLDQLKSGNTTSCGCVKSPNLIGRQFGRLKVIEEFENDTKQRKWLCQCQCGNKTILTSHILMSGHTQSCGCIRSESVSTWESLIDETLKSLGVSFEREKMFDDCRNVYPLRFDFYIPDINTCIEYDGEQHIAPIEYFGGEKAYITRVQNDQIKTNYCAENNINLIRISSKSKKEVIEIINNIIQNPVTTTVA